MSETLLMWMFGITGAWLVALSGTVLHLLIAQVKTNFAINLFIDSLGDKLAKALHADDDHLGLDSLLDKYLDQHYDLTLDEWLELRDKCNKTLEDTSVSQNERGMAGILAAVCDHKLTRYGVSNTKLLKK
jgi:hypothetical protein